MYFDWDNYVFKKYKKYKNVLLHCVIAPRNCGKTYGTYLYFKRVKTFTKDSKVLIMRNTDQELIRAKRDFANRFKDQLIVKGDFIYSVKYKKVKNDQDETVNVATADEIVGYFASINNYVNYKSIEAKDIKYILYEEFNEDTVIGRDIYTKFINILKTFERFNKLKYLFMLGNKDGFDSDFFVNWDILPPDDPKENKITEIRDNYGIIGVVYDLSDTDFKDLGNEKTLANRLAMLDNRTAGYANGMYLKEHSKTVISHKYITPTFNPMFVLGIDNNKYVFGTFEKGFGLISPWNIDQPQHLPVYSFDLLSGLINESVILDNDDNIDLIDFIYKKEKSNLIYYDSYDSKQRVRDLIVTHKRYIQKQ